MGLLKFAIVCMQGRHTLIACIGNISEYKQIKVLQIDLIVTLPSNGSRRKVSYIYDEKGWHLHVGLIIKPLKLSKITAKLRDIPVKRSCGPKS